MRIERVKLGVQAPPETTAYAISPQEAYGLQIECVPLGTRSEINGFEVCWQRDGYVFITRVPLVRCLDEQTNRRPKPPICLHFYDQNCKCAASCTVRAPFVVVLICWSPEPKA